MALLVGLALAAGACRGSTKADNVADPTVPTEVTLPASTTTTEPADPFAVPATIDAAYVNRVLVELEKVYGDVVRKIRATRLYERSDAASLLAIFNQPLFERQATSFGDIPGQDADLFRQPIGNRRITVERLVKARPDCIFATVTFDFSGVLLKPPPPKRKYITLKPTQTGADPGNINPTPWSYARETDREEDECGAE
ncbi:MAG: hypothetical protein M3P85_13955 [Actinomycetota bacterium]|nr:hypothetical protein [Actinomycetota bacterium]